MSASWPQRLHASPSNLILATATLFGLQQANDGPSNLIPASVTLFWPQQLNLAINSVTQYQPLQPDLSQLYPNFSNLMPASNLGLIDLNLVSVSVIFSPQQPNPSLSNLILASIHFILASRT